MATVYLTDTVHLRDNWGETVIGAAGISLSLADTVHLRDSLTHDIDAGALTVQYLSDEVHLRDSLNRYVVAGGGLTQSLADTVHLRDTINDGLEVAGIVEYLADEVHLRDEYAVTVQTTFALEHNANISFGDTEASRYKEYSHRFRWTNYNGVAVPDLNFKDLKEPIVRIMPCPSFLQFKYDNSFLLFTRNTINRFILDADVETGQWRAQTDNLIEEFKDLGLMEPKTLVLAGDTLFGLSEKGVWKWNKQGMSLISDKIIDLPDAGIYDYIAFYCPIRNQYILHRQTSSDGVYIMEYGSAYPYIDYPGVIAREIAYVGNDKIVHVRRAGGGTNAIFYAGASGIDRLTKVVTPGAQVIISYPGSIGGRGDCSVCTMNDTTVIVGCDDNDVGWVVMAATVNADNTLTLHTQTIIPSVGAFPDTFKLLNLNDSTFVVFYNITAPSYKLRYRVCTLSGTTITLGDEKNWDSGNFIYSLHAIEVQENKIIVFTENGTTTMEVMVGEYVGTDTLDMGTVKTITTTRASTNMQLAAPTGTKVFSARVHTISYDLTLQPFEIDGLDVTLGTETIETARGTVYGVGIASRGSSGFYIFFADADNANKGTAIFGSGTKTVMQLFEDTKTVFHDATLIGALGASIGSGMVVCGWSKSSGIYGIGYEQVWGMDYASIDSFVYQIDRDSWWRFLGIDILDIPVILSGGSLDENYNLWLDSDKRLMKYPSTVDTAVPSFIRTKEFYIQEGVFQRWMVDFEGVADVETRVIKRVGNSDVEETDEKFAVAPNKFRGLPLGKMRGRKMSVKIIDADIIKTLSLDVKGWGER